MIDRIIKEIEEEIERIEYENRDFICSTCLTTLSDLQIALPKIKEIKKDLNRIIKKILKVPGNSPELNEIKMQAKIFKCKYLLSEIKDENIFE